MRAITVSTGFPDPLLSANIYCGSGLNELLLSVVVPFWEQCIWPAGAEEVYLWFLRYAKGGEHLKLRVHGPASKRAALEQALSEMTKQYFGCLEPAKKPDVSRKKQELIAIDPEDREISRYPDRTLLWTRYQRSPVMLGPKPLIANDEYVGLFTLCLGKACGLVLATLASQDAGLSFGRRQKALRKVVSSGLGVLFPRAEEWWRYVTYHRDWLVRYPLLRAGGREEGARQTLARYESEMERLRIVLSRASSGKAEGSPRGAGTSQYEQGWLQSLLDLRHYLTVNVKDATKKLDPFVKEPFFPVFFKLFHGVANALGVNTLNEGLTYHQLLETVILTRRKAPFSLLPRGSMPRPLQRHETVRKEQEVPFDVEKDYRWADLVAASGPAGSQWAQLYRSSSNEILGYIQESLNQLRERRLEDGWNLLDRAERCRRSLLKGPPSIFYVVGRFYYGALAYAHFCQWDLGRAEAALRHAQSSIQAALETEDFLIPFATHSLDVRAKSILIARDQCRWVAVTRRIHDLRAITLDCKPLAVVRARNVPIFHSTIAGFICRTQNLTDEMKRAVVYLRDKNVRLAQYEAAVGAMYALPGFVIACP